MTTENYGFTRLRHAAQSNKETLLHFVAFFHVASLFSIGVDNEKALELDNRICFLYFSQRD